MTQDNDTSRQDALRALVDHWRTVAGKVVDSGYATATRLCADELERALLSGGGDAQDAARYRWLRSPDSGDAGTLVATLWNETLDAAIDREIAAMPTTPEASK